jgi:hypothetical protein
VPDISFGLVYGPITVGALLAAESAQRETYGETIGAVAIALLAYWLEHSYATYTSRRLREGKPLELAELGRTLARELSIVVGAAIPLVSLLAWWAAGGRLTSAVTAAVWTAAAVILVIEVLIGLRARLTGRDLVAQTALGATLGVLVIALRAVLH